MWLITKNNPKDCTVREKDGKKNVNTIIPRWSKATTEFGICFWQSIAKMVPSTLANTKPQKYSASERQKKTNNVVQWFANKSNSLWELVLALDLNYTWIKESKQEREGERERERNWEEKQNIP